jgi:hypothetical protein
VVWVFAAVAAVLVFAIAAGTVGRETFRLGHQPQATILDIDEAVTRVGDALPDEAQGRLTYDDVRRLIVAQLDHLEDKGVLARHGRDVTVSEGGTPDVVLADDDSVAVVLGRAEAEGLHVTDDDVFRVVSALHAYLEDIGAVGPPAAG